MSSKFDLIAMIENAIDEKEMKWEDVENALKTIESDIDDRQLRAPKKKSVALNSKKSSKDTNEDEEESLEVKKSDSKDLRPQFKGTEEEEEKESSDISYLKGAHVFEDWIDAQLHFRAAGSLKDSEVIERLKVYFKRMSPGERQVHFILVKEITQIANLGKDGNDARVPSDLGVSVNHSHPREEEKEKKAKLNKNTRPDENKKEIPSDKPEKTNNARYVINKSIERQKPAKSMSPIAVESKQDKTSILKVLKEINDK